jgi:hypothetical protein
MFRNAYSIARNFTWPVVLSRKTVGGQCSSTIGSLVVINDEGWIVTANHLLKQFWELKQMTEEASKLEAQREAINSDETIDLRERKRRLSRVKKQAKGDTNRCSAWWGKDGVNMVFAAGLDVVDLGIGRLDPFDPSWVPTYPTFKEVVSLDVV